MTRNPLIWSASAAVLFVGGCLGAWFLSLQSTTAQLPRIAVETRGALLRAGATEAARTRVMLAELFDEARKDALAKLQTEIRHGADGTLSVVKQSLTTAGAKFDAALKSYNATLKVVDGRSGELLTKVDAIRGDFKPVFVNVATFAANYAALPDRLGAELRPSWLSIQPEITCRQPDSSGYGGCMRGRLNGMFGEAVKVGGIFTQHFPSLITSFDGIQRDVHGWTDKYVMPHKLTPWQKVKVGLNVGKDVGIAGLRGGVF